MRCALSCWSQNSGRMIIGLPKCRDSVVVLLPPWVITRSASGSTEACGRNSAPCMFGASSSSACRGPIDTMYRCGVAARQSMTRRISPVSAEPSEPSEK